MEVRCDQCQARYRVDDARVGPKGLAMRCGKCGNTFRLSQDGTVSKASGAKPSATASIPTPATATPLLVKPTPPPTGAPVAPERGGDTVVFQPASQPPAHEPAADKAPLPVGEMPPAPPAKTPPAPTALQAAVAAPPAPEPATAPTPEPPIATPPAPSTPPAPARPPRPPRPMALPREAGPPRSLVLGTVVVLAGLLVAALAFVYWKRGPRSPPRAAVEALERAKTASEKDSLAALAEAETQATSAIEAAGSGFPAAYAELAEIDVAWADALNDQATSFRDRATAASRAGDESARQEADGKASAREDEARARLRQAFEAAMAGVRVGPDSKEAALALADYYRAAGSRTNMEVKLKDAARLGAEPARIAFVQGADFLAQDEGAPQAVEKLESAVAGAPASARSRFRLALAYLKAEKNSEARKELQETLRLSPAHERAKLALETLADRAETRDGKKR